MEVIQDLIGKLEALPKDGLFHQFFQLILWIVFILVLSWLIRSGLNRTITDNTLRYRVKKTIRLVSVVLVLLIVILFFTGKGQYVSLVIGLASAGLAFALQEVILSVAGWISIFSSKIYKTGDRIELNGVRGDVIDISITRTTLMEIGGWSNSDNYSGRIVQISNSFVFKGPVSNYSTDFPFVWDEIVLPIAYGSDLAKARSIVQDIASGHLMEYAAYAHTHWKQMLSKYYIENANVEPTLSVKLTDNWIELTLRYVVDYKKRRSSKTDLFTAIHEAIRASNGSVKIASATIDISGMPQVEVDLKESK